MFSTHSTGKKIARDSAETPKNAMDADKKNFKRRQRMSLAAHYERIGGAGVMTQPKIERVPKKFSKEAKTPALVETVCYSRELWDDNG